MTRSLQILLTTCLILLISLGCKNEEVNADHSEDGGNTFKDMPVDGIETHFNRITVDEAEYLILERDRNNPHEGFGFMAFRPNKMIRKQDSLMAYLETVMEAQAEILSRLKATNQETEKESLMLIYQEKLASKKILVE